MVELFEDRVEKFGGGAVGGHGRATAETGCHDSDYGFSDCFEDMTDCRTQPTVARWRVLEHRARAKRSLQINSHNEQECARWHREQRDLSPIHALSHASKMLGHKLALQVLTQAPSCLVV